MNIYSLDYAFCFRSEESDNLLFLKLEDAKETVLTTFCNMPVIIKFTEKQYGYIEITKDDVFYGGIMPVEVLTETTHL